MLSVDDAISAITADAHLCPKEKVALDELTGRVLAQDVRASITQPPFNASAMDGYALRLADLKCPGPFHITAEAPAGIPHTTPLKYKQAVRLYTGSAIPDGADYVLIQERTRRQGNSFRPSDNGPWSEKHNNIRTQGCDFTQGDVLLKRLTRLTALHLSLLAAANITHASVVRKPNVSVFSNGAELVDPGTHPQFGQIIDSNHYALCALIKQWGGSPNTSGRANDSIDSAKYMFTNSAHADIIIPVGGASVGDHDLVKPALLAAGGQILFEGVDVRPGKPLWFGRLGNAPVIGLPGNPASAIVTAILFAQPLVRIMAGRPLPNLTTAALTKKLPANGKRETWLRANVSFNTDPPQVTPAISQDSSLISPFALNPALIRRPAKAPPANSGDIIHIAILDHQTP